MDAPYPVFFFIQVVLFHTSQLEDRSAGQEKSNVSRV